MLAQIIAATINTSMSRPKKPVDPKSFMLTPFDEPDKRKRKRTTKKDRERVTSQIRKAFAGFA